MKLLTLGWYNLLSRPLQSLLSVLLLALGVGLVALLLHLDRQLAQQLTKNLAGIDLVVGAKGGKLQLILSSIYHIDAPTGNIKLEDSRLIGNNKQFVEEAIPLALGDSYKGFPIVGTDHRYLNLYTAALAKGKLFYQPLEVVLGAGVARKAGLKVGDSFFGSHGLGQESIIEHSDHAYTVAGILQPSGTVLDGLIITRIESVWEVHDHEQTAPKDSTAAEKSEEHEDQHHPKGEAHREEDANHDHEADEHSNHDHEGHHHDDHPSADSAAAASSEPLIFSYDKTRHAGKEITAYLVRYIPPGTMAAATIPRLIDQYAPTLGYAEPALETERLLNITGAGTQTLRTLAYLIIIVSGFSVFIALFNALRERRYEIALLRTMGASRLGVFSLTLAEGLSIGILGFVLGILLSKIGLFFLARFMEESYRYTFTPFTFLIEEAMIAAAALGIGIFAALIPALMAYRTNISQTLAKG